MKNLLNTITTGDARDLSSSIPDNSIDLIFTDPPYTRDQIHLYEWLSEEAARVLKPDGFLIAYVGTYWKFDAMQRLAAHLVYYWDCIEIHRHNKPFMWVSGAHSSYKSLLVFAKHRKHKPRKQFFDAWAGTGEDKRYHTWGQAESTARYYIDCFSSSRDIVWEPFAGGGTTLIACKVLERDFIAFEVDPDTADIARKRLETVQHLLMPEEMEQLALEVPA